MSKANLANAILAAPINTSATSATLVTGYGSTMPTVPFKMTFTKFGQLSTMGNSEIVLVTARSGEVLTIERAKGGTTAKAFEAGDIVSNGIYIENSTAVGDIFMSMRATPAAGRLFMDGGTYTKADYPLLYKLIQDSPAYGTTGGSAGSETFTLADMRERMPFGKSQNAPWATLGNRGGSNTKTLTEAQLPSISGSFGIHGQENGTEFAGKSGYATGSPVGTYTNTTPRGGGAGSLVNPGFAFGQGQAHDVMNPYIVVNFEIIAG